jgi:hypothetical protein
MIRHRMPIVLPPFQDRLSKAVAHYWRTLEAQTHKQKAGTDRGRRSAVTGGKQMDGFCELVDWVLRENGLGEASIYLRSDREIPGFLRPTKEWDMLVVHEGRTLAAVEFTSYRVPPVASDTKAHIEETIGMADDVWTAFGEGAYNPPRKRPWLGWVMLFEDRTVARSPTPEVRPPVEASPDFSIGSYGRRYEQILHKFTHERLFDSAALIASPGKGGAQGVFMELAEDLSMKWLLASLAGWVGGYLAEVKLRPCSGGGTRRCLPGRVARSRAAHLDRGPRCSSQTEGPGFGSGAKHENA